jgi:hypothetical protein
MERIYQQMLHWLALRGYRKPLSQTPLEYAHQSWNSQPASRAAAIEEISQAYVQWRYGGQNPDLTTLKQRLVDLNKTTVRR